MIKRKSEITWPFQYLLRSLVNTMLAVNPRIREISESDIDATADLLTRGFVYRSREYWIRGLRRQGTRPLPPDIPRYGYLLENEGVPVGCLLTIYSRKILDGEMTTCCNVSSWYVDPAFRNTAALFASMVQKRKDVTYFNVTPAHSTWPILEAQGFTTYCSGLYFSVPALSRGGYGMTIETVTPDTQSIKDLPGADLEKLKCESEYGNLSLVCHTAEGAFPFIFLPSRKRRGIIPMPTLQLGYCHSVSDYTRCAGAIGRYLLRSGKLVVIVDANGPIEGLTGVYREPYGRKYSKGPHRPRLGDLTDTELAIYGM
jgi:hypothetical protein